MKKVLVADDDFFNVQVLQAILKNAGHEVVPTYGGKDAIDTLHKEDISIVLLDISMPGIDGYTVLDYIMEDEKLKDIPVIIVSALSDSEYVDKALTKGAKDYITKPFINSEVLNKVEKLLK